MAWVLGRTHSSQFFVQLNVTVQVQVTLPAFRSLSPHGVPQSVVCCWPFPGAPQVPCPSHHRCMEAAWGCPNHCNAMCASVACTQNCTRTHGDRAEATKQGGRTVHQRSLPPTAGCQDALFFCEGLADHRTSVSSSCTVPPVCGMEREGGSYRTYQLMALP